MFGIIRNINNWMNRGQVKQEYGKKRYKLFFKNSSWYLCGPKFGDGRKFVNVLTFRLVLICEGRSLTSYFLLQWSLILFDTVKQRFRTAIYYKSSEKGTVIRETDRFFKIQITLVCCLFAGSSSTNGN